MEIVVSDAQMERIVNVIADAAKSGNIGDGKIFVSSIENAVRIRNGDLGEGAL